MQSTFNMDNKISDLDTLKDIKRIMERSSRFISLSGWSGIAAGFCALIGAFLGWYRLHKYYTVEYITSNPCRECLKRDLIIIAGIVFIAALVFASLFTFSKSKKEGVAFWGNTARRLLWNTLVPMLVGAAVLLRFIDLGFYEFISPLSLIFYGLALVNGSKYTLGEVKYLGYAEIGIGLINLWFYSDGLICWTIGFGIFHIVYGLTMWWKYERVHNSVSIDK